MWCDNCLLVLPLRHGAMAWAIIILLYSIAGAVFLLEFGQFIYFTYPEWQIYGGIGLGVAFIALINVLALSNRSYLWTRVCKIAWPFVIVIIAIRAIAMIVEMQRGKSKFEWECANGDQLWPASAEADYGGSTTMPSILCKAGFPALYLVFIIALLVDIAFQMYMFFMTWRYEKLLQHYSSLTPSIGGYYKA
ncbi:uncharacterized protein LAESUDRAFT_735802 [Laetiporus sulphureus 93-53]|uniref:Uncharacterized protein n=1 Tax=Laetiporus sulphureus 93-53 TaxID=1314785 RepID=A0A165F9K0_9APHY|nr:uncharacterized protein LAESUDRAFT_735802 [Laetiporus sulphureus 93-53]KZT08636.1 hypothetical protein LAESUDRAFT_735802 [Laetiporus sulphureus 93-53]